MPMRPFSSLCRKTWKIIKWTIDEEEFDDFFEQQRKNLPLALMVSHVVFTDALVDRVLPFCSKLTHMLWKVVLSTHTFLLRAGPFSFPSLPLSMTRGPYREIT